MALRTFTGYLRLTAGEHEILVDCYENRGVARAKVTFEPYLSRLIACDAVKWVRQP
jgi:hypothetical protein